MLQQKVGALALQSRGDTLPRSFRVIKKKYFVSCPSSQELQPLLGRVTDLPEATW